MRYALYVAVWTLAAGLCLLADRAAAVGKEAAPDAALQAVAATWFRELDSGKYRQCWDQSSEILKKNMPPASWENALADGLQRFGPAKSRTLTRSKRESNPQGPPPGEYAYLEYAAKREKREIKETLVLRLESGTWRVAGYLVY